MDCKIKVSANEFGPWRMTSRTEGEELVAELVDLEPLAARRVIKNRLRQAGQVLRRTRLPGELRCLVGAANAWPDIVREREKVDEVLWRTRLRPAIPSARELDRLDECLNWLLWLTPEERAVAGAYMAGFGSRRIAAIHPAGVSHDTIHRIYNRAVSRILTRLIAQSTTYG